MSAYFALHDVMVILTITIKCWIQIYSAVFIPMINVFLCLTHHHLSKWCFEQSTQNEYWIRMYVIFTRTYMFINCNCCERVSFQKVCAILKFIFYTSCKSERPYYPIHSFTNLTWYIDNCYMDWKQNLFYYHVSPFFRQKNLQCKLIYSKMHIITLVFIRYE